MRRVFGVFLAVLLLVTPLLTVPMFRSVWAEPLGWSKTYGGIGSDSVYSLVQTGDGGYAMLGGTDSYGAGNGDFWLIKTDSFGNAQWNKTYGGANWDGALAVVQTGDGGYALAGSTLSYGAGNNDFWLIKTDPSGNAQWNKTYGGTSNDYANSVVQTGDGEYALVGCTNSYGLGNGDFWFVKADADGNAQWNKTYGGTQQDWACSVIQTSDGGYALAGYIGSSGPAGSDGFLVKTDAYGVIPEQPSNMIFAAFMVTATLAVVLTKRKHRMRLTQGS
jgi:hypothetical protein